MKLDEQLNSLIGRLKYGSEVSGAAPFWVDLCEESADALESLLSEVRRLREFREFVARWTIYKPNKDENAADHKTCIDVIAGCPDLRDFQAARSSLEPEE